VGQNGGSRASEAGRLRVGRKVCAIGNMPRTLNDYVLADAVDEQFVVFFHEK